MPRTRLAELSPPEGEEKLTLQELENIQQEILLSQVKRNRKTINGGKKRKNKTKRKKLKNKKNIKTKRKIKKYA